jgi:hypothetical protein
MNLCASCYHRADQHIYEEGACRPGYVCPDGCEKFASIGADRTVDPLAAGLMNAYVTALSSGRVGADEWQAVARVAREHIAAEIEASISATQPQNRAAEWIIDGKRMSARIARGGNDE